MTQRHVRGGRTCVSWFRASYAIRRSLELIVRAIGGY